MGNGSRAANVTYVCVIYGSHLTGTLEKNQKFFLFQRFDTDLSDLLICDFERRFHDPVQGIFNKLAS